MVLNFDEFETFPARKLLESESEPFEIEYDGLIKVKNISSLINIQKSNEEFFCQLKLDAKVEIECARCLSPFESRVQTETDFIACAQAEYEKIKDIADNEDYLFFEGGGQMVDLTSTLSQAIILSISLKPLCSDNCRGLCPSCGVNLNKEQCGCKKESIDPRWEKLKELSSQSKKEGNL